MQNEPFQNITTSPFDYTLFLADSSLIMGHRLSEWTGHGPSLEQDIAITNIALDLIGQSRNFYQYATSLAGTNDGAKVTEDDLAYLRNGGQFKNLLITELPNGDWGKTILKIFFFSTWQYFYFQKLIYSSDKQLAAIAEKSLKEVTYHTKWSSEWLIRLGDGTAESHRRISESLQELWPYTGELFEQANYDEEVVNNRIGIAVNSIKNDWEERVAKILEKATLPLSKPDVWMHTGRKGNTHTEHLGYILAEMQYLHRAFPGCEW